MFQAITTKWNCSSFLRIYRITGNVIWSNMNTFGRICWEDFSYNFFGGNHSYTFPLTVTLEWSYSLHYYNWIILARTDKSFPEIKAIVQCLDKNRKYSFINSDMYIVSKEYFFQIKNSENIPISFFFFETD